MIKPSNMIGAAVMLISSAASSGALVTFSSVIIDPTNTTGSYLNNSGTILDAVSYGTPRVSPYTYNAPTTASNPNNTPTINGITFTGGPSIAAGGNVTSTSGNNFTITSSSGNLGYDNGRFSNIPYTNQALYGLTYDVLRTGGNDQRMVLNLTNLTLGSNYSVQLIFSTLNTADNPAAANSADRAVQIAAGTFTAGANTQIGTGSDGSSGTYHYGSTTGAIVVTASFTADSATEQFNLLSGTTGINSRLSLAAIVVSQVPEASTSMLAAAGVAALAFSRRRKSA